MTIKNWIFVIGALFLGASAIYRCLSSETNKPLFLLDSILTIGSISAILLAH